MDSFSVIAENRVLSELVAAREVPVYIQSEWTIKKRERMGINATFLRSSE